MNLTEQIGQTIGAKHGETKPCRVCRELSDFILALIRERVEKVKEENPFVMAKFSLMRYDAFDDACDAVLKALEGE